MKDILGLVSNAFLSEEMLELLAAAMRAGHNILVSGEVGSGKTRLVNGLIASMPEDAWFFIIQDAPEMQVQQVHAMRWQTSVHGHGAYDTPTLVRSAFRVVRHLVRIVVDELRSEEAATLWLADMSGPGFLATLRANSPREALARLVELVALHWSRPTSTRIRAQLAMSVYIVIHMTRERDGRQRVASISEVTGVQGEELALQTLYEFRAHGADSRGAHYATGVQPRCLADLRRVGYGAGTLLPESTRCSED